MARVDQMQALYEFFGGQATTLAASVDAGIDIITVDASFPVGVVQIDLGSNAEENYVTDVSGTGPYTLTLQNPLVKNHTAPCVVTTWSTSPSSVFPYIQTVAKGEPIRRDINQMPYLYFVASDSSENRMPIVGGGAQKKTIEYTLSCIVENWVTGSLDDNANRGEQIINDFYVLLDDIADKIRTNKLLITTNYPYGAAMKFGEQFKIKEEHAAAEDSVILRAQINIVSVEQVNA